jgi:hypothetical protein
MGIADLDPLDGLGYQLGLLVIDNDVRHESAHHNASSSSRPVIILGN